MDELEYTVVIVEMLLRNWPQALNGISVLGPSSLYS
jgi:hypothetical protein